LYPYFFKEPLVLFLFQAFIPFNGKFLAIFQEVHFITAFQIWAGFYGLKPKPNWIGRIWSIPVGISLNLVVVGAVKLLDPLVQDIKFPQQGIWSWSLGLPKNQNQWWD